MASFSEQPAGAVSDVVPVSWQLRHARESLRRLCAPRYVIGLALAPPLVGLVFARFGASGHGVLGAFVVAVLGVLAIIDIAERRLPNRIVLPSAGVVLAAQTIVFPDRALESTVAAACAALALLVPALVHPAALGMGDVKLALLLGATLGVDVITALVLAFVAAAGYAVFLLVRHGGAARHQTMPLGPFLAFGGIVALLV